MSESGHIKCVLCEGVFIVLKSHFWERDSLCDPVECDYLVQFSLKFWAAITETTVVDQCSLQYRLTVQRHRNFLKINQRVLLKKCISEAEFVVSAPLGSCTLPTRFRQSSNATYLGRWSGRGGSNA